MPAACVSKTRIVPRTPGWVFVLNFDVFDASAPPNPVGCMLLYRVVYAPTDFVSLPCKTVGQVTYGGGRAALNGGYIYCGINIKQQLAALTPPAVVSDTASYPYFTIVGVGSVTITTGVGSDPYSNPIGYYKPNDPGSPGLGLFVPILPNDQQMVSTFNGVTNTVTQTRITTGPTYTFTVVHDGGPEVYTTTHYLDDKVIGQFTPRSAVNFYTNGGAFWIGVAPQNLATTYRGTLDEVIFDPPDGGKPPSFNHDQFLSFTPLTMRGP